VWQESQNVKTTKMCTVDKRNASVTQNTTQHEAMYKESSCKKEYNAIWIN